MMGKRLLSALFFSRRLGALLLGGWAFLYAVLAIWNEEAFSKFVVAFRSYPVVSGLFWLFTLNLAGRSIAVLRCRLSLRPVSAVLAFVFPLGILSLLVGFGLSLSMKQFITPIVAQGDVISTPWGAPLRVIAVDTGLRDTVLDTEEGSSGIFTYEPSLRISTGRVDKSVKAFPPTAIGGSHVHILQFGIGPEVVVARNKHIFRREWRALQLLPPPRADTFRLPPLPYDFTAKLVPARTFRKRDLVVNEYSVTEPVLYLRVIADGREIAAGEAHPSLSFTDLEISFPRWDPWALVEVVRDPGIVPTFVGLFLVALGTPLWFLSRPWRFESAPGANPSEDTVS